MGETRARFSSAGTIASPTPISPQQNEGNDTGEVVGVVSGASRVLGGGDARRSGEIVSDDKLDDSEEPQARKPKIPVDPGRPTKKEVEEHNTLHWPVRAWHPHCVGGKAMTSPHPRRDAES